jgi:hypothetical protein
VLRKHQERPNLAPNLAPLLLGLPVILGLLLLSGVWWLLGIVTVLCSLRFILWLLSPYSDLTNRAIQPRHESASDLLAESVDPYRHIPVIGWLMRLGAWVLSGSHPRRDD